MRMGVLRSRTLPFRAILALGSAVLICPGLAMAYTPEQQQACSDDAFRLCSSDIPDIDRITACMIRNKEQLSPACRVFFREDPDPPQAGARPAGKPMNIKPGTASTSARAKSHKQKKAARPNAT